MGAGVTTHELKSWPVFFEQVWSGAKNFELRRDDRGFAVGDMLHLREWHPGRKEYTGRELFARVSYILGAASAPTGGLEPGHVVMGIDRQSKWEEVPVGG